MNNPDSIESAYRALIAERERIDKAIAALAPLRGQTAIVTPPNGVARKSAPATPMRKAHKKHATVTDAVRARVMDLSAMPAESRPSAPMIAKTVGISLSTVQRIRKQAKRGTGGSQ